MPEGQGRGLPDECRARVTAAKGQEQLAGCRKRVGCKGTGALAHGTRLTPVWLLKDGTGRGRVWKRGWFWHAARRRNSCKDG